MNTNDQIDICSLITARKHFIEDLGSQDVSNSLG